MRELSISLTRVPGGLPNSPTFVILQLLLAALMQ